MNHCYFSNLALLSGLICAARGTMTRFHGAALNIDGNCRARAFALAFCLSLDPLPV